MSRISDLLQQIMDAVYGKDVRGAIHDSIEECYSDVSTAKTLAQDATANANTAANTANTAAANANAAKDAANAAAASAGAALDYVATVENSSAASIAHAKGSSLIYDGALYEAIDDISIGDTLTIGTNIALIPGGLGSEVYESKAAFNSVLVESSSTSWTQGGYSTANGNPTSSSTRIKCRLQKQCVFIDIQSGFKALILAYNSDDSYVGTWDGTQYRKSATWMTGKHFLYLYGNYTYKLVGAYTNDGEITPSDNTGIKVYELCDNSVKPQRQLTSTDNFDNVTEPGVYYFTESIIDNPLNTNAGILCVFPSPRGSNYILQIIVNTEGMFERIRGSTNWGPWRKLFSYANPLYSTDDLNDITTDGTYHFSSNNTPVNSPVANVSGVLVVSRSGSYIEQRLTIAGDGSTKTYVRRSDTGTVWFAWQRYANVSDISFQRQLPVLSLMGDTTGMSKDDAVTLNYSVFNQTGTCSVKWQGSSSVRYAKKNYTISFDTAIDGWNKWATFVNSLRSNNGNISRVSTNSRWGSRTKFCMKANWVDASMAKNIVCARLWGQIVKSRVDAQDIDDGRADAPNYGAIDGFPIEIQLNDESLGLYTFNIPKDKWQFAMGSGAAEYVVSGEDNNKNACKWKATALVDGTDYSVEYAPNDVEASTIAASLNAAISAAMSAGANWETDLAPYLDIDSVFDYFIFTCCVSNTDALARNILYGTYDGTKWFMSAYDMDTTFGADPYGSMLWPVVTQRTQFAEAASMHQLAYLMLTYSPTKLKQRYQALRRTVLSEENVWHEMANFVVDIPARCYDINNDIWATMPGTSMMNVANFMEYYRMHCKYLDDEIAALN